MVVPSLWKDAIQVKGKGKKGGKDGKPTCKICGKNHHGECWAKGQPGKGKTQQGKGKGDGKSQGKGKGKGDKSRSSSPEKCQICGKNNHTAQNCFQRYKGSVQQASNAAEKPGPSVGQVPQAPSRPESAANHSNHVAAIGERERSTLQLRLRWQEPQWESLQPTSMAKQGVYWIQVLMSTSVLQTLQNGSSL